MIGGGSEIARQGVSSSDEEHVAWVHRDASGLSLRSSGTAGAGTKQPEELDGLGNNVGIVGSFQQPQNRGNSPSPAQSLLFNDMAMGDCEVDGFVIPCSMRDRMVESLTAIRRVYINGVYHAEELQIIRDLPGRALWIFAPDRLRGTGGAGRAIAVDNEPVIDAGESWSDWEFTHGQVSYLNIGWDWFIQTSKPYALTGDDGLIKAARAVIANATGKCADLLGKNALTEFDRISQKIRYDEKYFANSSGAHSARTTGEDIRLNPNSYTFNPTSRPLAITEPGKRSLEALNKLFKDSKAASWREYAVAAIIHEFLHATGEFDDDTVVTAFGADSSESIKNQKEVIKKCFREQGAK